MKNKSVILNIILLIAVIVLFILHFTGGKQQVSENKTDTLDRDTAIPEQKLKIAVVKLDSLIAKDDYWKKLEEEYAAVKRAKENEIDRRQRKLEKEAQEFYKKAQTGAFLSKESMQLQQAELAEEQQNLMLLGEQYQTQLMEERARVESQWLDSVKFFINLFNKDEKYDFIITATNILYSPDYSNITDTIISGLNSRYQARTTTEEEVEKSED